MPKPSKRRTSGSAASTPATGAPNASVPPAMPPDETPAPGTTGRYLVLLQEDDIKAGVSALGDTAGIRSVARSGDFESGAVSAADLAGTEAVVFDDLGVAVVQTPPDQIRALGVATAEAGALLAVEPERVVYALQAGDPDPAVTIMPPPPPPPSPSPPTGPVGLASGSGFSFDYLRGYRDAVNELVDRLLGEAGLPSETADEAFAAAFDESELTWGLQATRVASSRWTGRGVRVAVLDTGMDLNHPDFVGRRITARSFIDGESVQDGHGHGTHCIGTACGPLKPARLPRYGVAHECEIFAGKVLSNRGSGSDGGILAGIQWAVQNGCAVVSMSLGAPVRAGARYSSVFEQAARRALNAGTHIIAAAGNDSGRPSHVAPVSHPANCPSILAVAALDARLRVAYFSNGGINPESGQIDIAGPGVAVYSAWPLPDINHTISGTSMATPHVAGIAALYAEAHAKARCIDLFSLLTQNARRLELPARDVGAGLVQAP